MLQIGDKVELSLSGEIVGTRRSLVNGEIYYSVEYDRAGVKNYIEDITDEMIVQHEAVDKFGNKLGE